MTKEKGRKWDGKSRISNDLYRKRFNEIFKKKGGVSILLDTSESPKDKKDNEYEEK
jgi:hypothetical protein